MIQVKVRHEDGDHLGYHSFETLPRIGERIDGGPRDLIVTDVKHSRSGAFMEDDNFSGPYEVVLMVRDDEDTIPDTDSELSNGLPIDAWLKQEQ